MLKACLVGSAVTLLMVAIPVVHFLTAIPSPFIGGYFAGSRAGATAGQAVVIGLVMAVLLVIPVGLVMVVPALLFGFGSIFVVAGALAYAGWIAMLGTLGAAIGGAGVRKQAAGSTV